MQIIIKNKLTIREVKDKNGNNALYYAAFYGHTHIIEELCKKEVPYEASDNGTTCLHIAAKRGHLGVVQLLLNYKDIYEKANHPWDNSININARKHHKSTKGATPAFFAAKLGHFEIFKTLHENGAYIEDFACVMGGEQEL